MRQYVRHQNRKSRKERIARERGAALATTIFMMGILSAIAMSVLAVVNSETRIAGSDLQRTQTFYASAAGIEKMTSDFNALFSKTSRPSGSQLASIALSPPTELVSEGFALSQTISMDISELTAMRASQGIGSTDYPRVTIPSGPYAGLNASVAPYVLNSTATSRSGAQVSLTRRMNNYLIPLFQFGMFSNDDLEVHPGPQFTFNGRVHANGNLYFSGNVKFLDKVTTANEAVIDVLRNGSTHDSNVTFEVGSTTVSLKSGSVLQGPNFSGASTGQRGFFPGSPDGSANANWATTSTAAAQVGVANQFGGQLQTRVTGISPLLLPLQLDGNSTRELIKRRMPNDNQTLRESRYHTKAQIRILIDNESGSDASGIPSGKGVLLSQFDPIPLPAGNLATGGRALWRIGDNGSYIDGLTTCVKQGDADGLIADTVRSVKGSASVSSNLVKIPAGAGLSGRILIEIVAPNGATQDVTTQILSLGMTEGEPNGIVYLQRPLWAAFTQGARDSSGGTNYLTYILSNYWGADGEIKVESGIPAQDATYGYLTGIEDDGSGQPIREDSPAAAGEWNSIVPINIYNVREGRISTGLNANTLYERGMMSVIEINMRNLSRWVDGVYDANLLAGTNAVSTNIESSDGYVLYVSDRRGDKIRSERDSTGSTLSTTNGVVDNEDIYGPNNMLDPGEDVIDSGVDGVGAPKHLTLQKDTSELPDPATLTGTGGASRFDRAKTAAAWLNTSNYFRRSVRLFNAEDLQITGGANKLSASKGITVSSENPVYIWGNYNTTGINGQPAFGATLNDSSQANYYLGNQIASSIVCDSFFPLSKTWFDSSGAMYPDDLGLRLADRNLPGVTHETSVRAAIIAGKTRSAMSGSPDAGNPGESRLNGGIHNFPRFLENWRSQRWNFAGSLIPLYHSTQALGPYNADSTIYSPPTRNWAFDTTYRDPNKLPPGTPAFQYIQPSAFRQVL